ncbi:hypothetical protein GCM10011579_055500 [Streptomyces albiflavescens]|uniref:Uncharacterized protein n=1 Tax=Streptomyces albiflavescens TaxID=1623582 RepID=A0A918D7A5_9ACTN|nr:hypothetical protein GCM10011579_055500 [Streptomyces albiflavescens]
MAGRAPKRDTRPCASFVTHDGSGEGAFATRRIEVRTVDRADWVTSAEGCATSAGTRRNLHVYVTDDMADSALLGGLVRLRTAREARQVAYGRTRPTPVCSDGRTPS